VLELNPALVFPILEIPLGGKGRPPVNVTREITEIEQSILEGLYRTILNDLREACVPSRPLTSASTRSKGAELLAAPVDGYLLWLQQFAGGTRDALRKPP
jgi:flagellar motor switch protein FliM